LITTVAPAGADKGENELMDGCANSGDAKKTMMNIRGNGLRKLLFGSVQGMGVRCISRVN
jgi:hypothetical protein